MTPTPVGVTEGARGWARRRRLLGPTVDADRRMAVRLRVSLLVVDANAVVVGDGHAVGWLEDSQILTPARCEGECTTIFAARGGARIKNPGIHGCVSRTANGRNLLQFMQPCPRGALDTPPAIGNSALRIPEPPSAVSGPERLRADWCRQPLRGRHQLVESSATRISSWTDLVASPQQEVMLMRSLQTRNLK